MKICPTCDRSFDSGDIYCPDDGATLVQHPAYNTPTQVVNTPVPAAPSGGAQGAFVYVLFGGMAVAIIALLVAVYFLYGSRGGPANGGHSDISQPKADPVKPADTPGTRAERSITETDARNVLNRWLDSQNQKNFGSYRALYHTTFVGYKVTPEGEQDRQGYGEWVRDRQKMVANFINVQADNERITVAGEIATIKFTQRWQSARHCDIGEKEITIKMIDGTPKIVSEIIRNPFDCP